MAWNFADRAGELQPGARIDAALRIEEDGYSAAAAIASGRSSSATSAQAAQSGG
ncbi:MAG: hypothetical protein ACRD30_01910 [Bryobacteraceae bacterium]